MIPKLIRHLLIAIAVAVSAATAASVSAGEAKAAVAANFMAAMKALAKEFETESGHTASIAFGSTGKLYTQILHGAPFELFLAADRRHPRLLQKKSLVADGMTYATGALVLWGRDESRKVDRDTLAGGQYNRLALANPRTAPYGTAALTVLQRLGLLDKIPPSRRIQGNNVAQAYQFVATGNADIGFIALSQALANGGGSLWPVPQELHEPIRQDAVLLERGKNNPAARALFDYLKSDSAKALIRKYGYAAE